MPAPLVLASASPRRRELLQRAGVTFEVIEADVDEAMLAAEAPRAYAARVARAKAHTIAARRPDAWVLGADTIVVLAGEVLGKAADDAEAAHMIARLAGRSHQVTTAVCLLAPSNVEEREIAVTTEVVLAPLDDREVAAYVATGEWRGKAGAYAAQGIAGAFVRELRGSYTNVVGLPLAEVLALLRAAGAPGADLARGTPA